MRIALYHKDFPQGKVFTDDQEVKIALLRGWVEAPWLVNEVQEDVAQVIEDHVEKVEVKKPRKKPGPKKGFKNASKK